MVKQSLTDLSVRKLAPKTEGRYDVWDMRVPGLGIRVFDTGAKSFFLSYRIHGKRRRDTLGRYPEISLAKARQMAFERRGQIANGEDPAKVARKKKATFETVSGEFIALHVERHTKTSTARMYTAILRNEFLPLWGSRAICDIERQDVIALLDKIVARGNGASANYAYAVISKFFNWCVSRDLIDASPCSGVEKPAKTIARDRVLAHEELGRIWLTSMNVGYPFGTIVALLLLTGQRRGEVTNMEWEQIDWDEKTWNIPGALTKNKRPHSLPLTKSVLGILESIPRINDQKFVFQSRGSRTTTFSGFSKSKKRLDELAEVDNWRLHDLRRTAATGMAKLEVPPHVIERVLNHSTGQLGGIAGVYNRFQYLNEMRDALEKWAEHVLSLQEGK